MQEHKKLVSGEVTVLNSPISERYCRVGDTATLDVENKQIRCGGAWFNFDERWTVEQYYNYKCSKCGSTYTKLKKKLDYSNCVTRQPFGGGECNGQLITV